jgi:hypothetical protein
MNPPPGRQLWAGLELLDHQILDRNGRMAGKVDDLEFEIPADPDSLPTLTALLSGPGALAAQIGGAAGRWLAAVEQRLTASGPPGPAHIPVALVNTIGTAVELNADREDLDSNRAERWARDVLIAKIPGAGHEAE